MSEKTCSNCGKPVSELLRLDADMKGRLASDVGMTNVPESVCPDCYNSLSQQVTTAAQKKSRRIAKEQHRLNLWRSRVHLIREARERFSIKDFPGAVVAYEKYFRVLEIIYEVKPNEIKPAYFNNSARSKELVVITSAYWDLVRIYDQSKRFAKRLDQCAEKLAEFLPFTPIYGEILRKIEDYKKTTAKNKDVFERIMKTAGRNRGRCFIATAAFESAESPIVVTLCLYRDQVLQKRAAGRAFTQVYYKVSPPIAQILDRSEFLKGFTRRALTKVARFLELKYNLKTDRQ